MADMDLLLEDLRDEIEAYLREKEEEIKERLAGPLKYQRSWYGAIFEMRGYTIRTAHDAARHRWRFCVKTADDNPTEEFFETSEKKGQEIVDFLKALVKFLSPREKDHSEDIFAGAAEDPQSSHDETFEDEEAMPK